MKMSFLGVLVAAALMVAPALAAEKVTPQSEVSKTLTQMEAVNINTASAEQLTQLKGVGESKAQAIIEYRKAHGGFKNLDELTQVKGIGPKLLEQNRASLKL
ncbi:competence protein ComEA [Shewanella colwelliana]|uniref:Competence protein ComEA n=1 Tax=Shewanella colwelliana TaxID=23 RepID=A0A1E5IVX4_SHECO|nr:ComEA family DNA-binding protein [Shewanella colwelliana]OEG74700.1 competence protein ComEA [Shewanella colwelliana]